MDLTESIAPRSDQERWLAVPGYEGSYEVSDQGRVRSLTRCLSGHSYDADNTYVRPSGSRVCNECRRIYRAEQVA